MNAEERLKKAIKNGDAQNLREAFRLFYEENVRLVYCVLIEAFGKDDDTDDDIQEAFVSLLNNPERVSDVERLREYWIQSAKYIRGHRKEKQNRVVKDGTEEVPDETQPIPEQIFRSELFANIIEWLGHPDADIVILRGAYQLSEKEVAKRLGLGEDAVGYRYRKGLKALKRRLKDEA